MCKKLVKKTDKPFSVNLITFVSILLKISKCRLSLNNGCSRANDYLAS